MKKEAKLNNKILVSVIMSAYNAERSIEGAIKSILDQDYRFIELIICDDKSSDSTYEIIKKYSYIDKRITVLKNLQNKGLAYSLNRCIEKSRGEYIARMDADDVSHKTRISKQVEFLNNNIQYDIVGSNANLVSDEGVWGYRKTKEIPTKLDLIKGNIFIHPSVMIRKNTLYSKGMYTVSKDTIRGQDYDLWFKLYSKGIRGYNIQEALIDYSESKDDYKRKNFKSRMMEFKIRKNGYKLLGVRGIKRIYLLKPIINAIVPNRILYLIKKIRGE